MSAVQYFGVEAVIEAYSNRNIPAFAIWSGKQLLFRYDGQSAEGDAVAPSIAEGEQILRQFLENLYQGSTATYILKTYDDLKPKEKIRPTTEYDTAFNFKLMEPVGFGGFGMPVSYPRGQGGGHGGALISALEKLDARLLRLEGGTDAEESPQTLNEAVIGLIDDPVKTRDTLENVKMLVDIGRSLLGFNQSQPAFVGAVTRAQNNPAATIKDVINDEADQTGLRQRLEIALNTLGTIDPDIIIHLEKLASIAQTSPVKFKSLLSILETM